MGFIKFIKEYNLIKIYNDIDEDVWINNTIPLEFDYFNIDDDILEYMEHIQNCLNKMIKGKQVTFLVNMGILDRR